MSRPAGQGISRPAGQPVSKPITTRSRAAARPPEAQSRLRGILVVLAKLVGIPAFAAMVVIGLLYVRLQHGPIALDFLIQPIEKAIGEELSGLRVRIEGVTLRLADSGEPEFELKNVRVADARDAPLALAASATVSLSHRALLAARIAPESVALVSPRLSLFYNEEGTLSLKFAAPIEGSDVQRAKAQPTRVAAEAAPAGEGALARIDLVKVLSESSASARRREYASSYLRGIGLKAATVVIDNGTRKSIWHVPELDIDLDHRRSRSSIAGRVTIDSLAGPWTINFRTYEHENAKALQLALSVQGLVPRGLARTLPQLAGLESFDVPVWGDAKLVLSSSGEILSGEIGVDAAPGRVLLPWLAATPLKIDGGHLALSYSSTARRFEIGPSVVVWGDSRVQFTGAVTQALEAGGPAWSFEIKSAGGWIAAEPPHLPKLTIDDWSARGSFAPERGRIELTHFSLRAGGTEVTAEGDVSDMAGAMRARLDGRIGPMSITTFKTLWPSLLAPHAREWVVSHLQRGTIQGGSFRLASGTGAGKSGWDVVGAPEGGSLTLEGADLALSLLPGWPELEAPRALLRLDRKELELTVPDGAFARPDGRRIALKGAFTVDMTEPLPRTGRTAFRLQGPLSLALEMLDAEPLRLMEKRGLPVAGAEGKVEGQLTVSLPLGQALGPGDVVVEGKARVSEARLGQALDAYEVSGVKLAIDMAPTAAEARGEMLINGIPAKANWQHVYAAPPDKQPPLRISANLDANQRRQLGIEVNDLLQGDVGVEVTIAGDGQGERRVHLRADLVNADVTLESVAWRKPRGRSSLFEADIVRNGPNYPTELNNVRLVGDDVAIEGWIGIGADNKLKEFRFPNFSLNVVTSLETHGKVRPDGVWDVTAKGPTYDGRSLFRSFFDVAHLGPPAPATKVRAGVDLKAEIETVIGYSDTTLRKVRMRMQKQGDKITWLDVRGVLEGGKPFAAEVRSEPGQSRRLRAEALDAGLIFKLVGFYPNAVGGIMNLEVDLDGRGPAERTGTLWARDFLVLGDPIVSEVLQNADGTPAGGRRTVQREQFEFEIMRVPFSVGHGQFVMHDAVINGELVSASLRGKVDFQAQVLDVGGTYVPMSSLMRVPAAVPLLGPVLAGPRGEGIFGITFAIQGPMARPQVMVNPLSIITPGIFREIFQMTPDDPRVVPRERPVGKGDGVRPSVPSAKLPGAGLASPNVAPEGGGWSLDSPSRKR